MKKTQMAKGLFNIIIVLGMVASFFACQKDNEGRQDVFPFDPLETGYNDWVNGIPPQNLNVVLKDEDKQSQPFKSPIGFVKFRQDNSDHIINLSTWVYNLKPRHVYQLQRAVNPITDPDCTSTAWLTLGKGLVVQSIHTNAFGFGQEDLFRNISAIASGTQFRIHFQIIDSVTNETVLTSTCLAYTVK
jgi:hypothetical protein